MKNLMKLGLAAALFTAAGLSAALAHDFKLGDLEIGHPYARTMAAGAKVGGGYLKITNNGTADDRLIAISSPRASAVQLHEMKVEHDVMKMREIRGGIALPAGEAVELKPGGLHVMFMDVAEPFAEGEKIKAALTFERAGTIEVEFNVQAATAAEGHHDSGHGGHATP